MARLDGAERFVFERTLGSGAMGTVHQAHDTVRGSTVALKVLHHVDPTSLLRFKNEFRALSRLAHPHLLQLYELLQTGDGYVLSMELVDGADFLSHVRSKGDARLETTNGGETESVDVGGNAMPRAKGSVSQGVRKVGELDTHKLRKALRQLADGLHALHQSGQLHRDLKPANVLVFRDDERLVICDFGLVTDSMSVGRTGAPMSLQQTLQISAGSVANTNGEIAGTLAFMSPEQASGGALTPATDWYSVGAMLYQALTLRVPFDPSLSWAEAVAAKQKQLPPHPLAVSSAIPADLANLAIALLVPEPSARAGYEEVVAVLEGTQREALFVPELPQLLVGRERELELLSNAYHRAQPGRPAVAMLSGTSGMGKSAVVERFLAQRESEGALVLRGRCYECEDLPYKAFDPLMDALSVHLLQLDEAAITPLLPRDLSFLVGMFPVLARVPLIAMRSKSEVVADPFERKRRAASCVKELLANIAAQRRLIIYVDDLQWSDVDSGPFFAELLRGEDAPQLLLLFAFRAEDEANTPLIRAMREQYVPASAAGAAVDVRIDRLSVEAAERLALVLLSGVSNGAQAAPAIVREAGGSPFFLRELCSYVRSHGAQSIAGLTLPTVIESRLASLPERSRTLLEFVAASGRPERQVIINEASGLGRHAFAAGQILKAHNLIHGSGGQRDGRVEAYHDRIRETTYRALAADRKAYIHRLLAVTLEQVAEREKTERDAEALFEHWRHAGENARALDYALLSAERAEAALAFLHAAKFYRLALELAGDDPTQRSLLEGKLGKALMYGGRGVEAAAAFFRALPGASDARARDLRRMGLQQLLAAGELKRAFAELTQAEALLGLELPKTNGKAIGMLLWRRMRTRLNDRTLDQHRKKGKLPETQAELDNLYRVSTALSTVDFLRGGVYTAEHTLRAIENGHPRHLASALSIESIRSAGPNKDPKQTQWIIDKGRALADAMQEEAPDAETTAYVLAITNGTAGVCRYLEGKLSEATRLTKLSQQIHRQRLNSTFAWDLATMQIFELRAAAMMGNLAELTRRVPELLRDAEARGDRYASTMFRVSRMSWAWLVPDHPVQAQAQIDIAHQQWTQEPYQLTHYYMLQASVETALYENRAEQCWERVRAEQKQAKLVSKIQFVRIELAYLVARVALEVLRKSGDGKARAVLRGQIRALKGESVGWGRALGTLMEACLLSLTDRAEAATLMEGLPATFEALEMGLFAAIARYRGVQWRGGDELESAAAALRQMGIKRPAAFVNVLAPGGSGRGEAAQASSTRSQ